MNRLRLLLHDWLLSLADWVYPKPQELASTGPRLDGWPRCALCNRRLDEPSPRCVAPSGHWQGTDFDWDDETNYGERPT